MKKNNGFSRPPNPLQLLSYLYFFAITFTYFFITFPLSSNISKVSFSIFPVVLNSQFIGVVLHVITAIAVVISGLITTIIDPTDDYILKTRRERAVG